MAKSNKRVELGHNILVTSDQWGFIVDHKVVEKQADVSLSIPLADRLLSRYGEGAIESMSFDKGFYKKEGWVWVVVRYLSNSKVGREFLNPQPLTVLPGIPSKHESHLCSYF